MTKDTKKTGNTPTWHLKCRNRDIAELDAAAWWQLKQTKQAIASVSTRAEKYEGQKLGDKKHVSFLEAQEHGIIQLSIEGHSAILKCKTWPLMRTEAFLDLLAD